MKDKKILKHFGWTIECQSPYEIKHEDGSFASGQAAHFVIEQLRSEYIEEQYEKLQDEYIQLKAKESTIKTFKKLDNE